MSTPKFIEIVEDPWVNGSDEFVFVVQTVSSTNDTTTLLSPSGLLYRCDSADIVTESTAYPVYEHFQSLRLIIIPPKFKFGGFIGFIGFQGTLEDLRGYF